MKTRTLADGMHRRRHAAIAGHRGDIAGARAHIGDPEAEVRAAALGALHRADGLEAADLDVALSDMSVTVRRRALELVAALQGRGPSAAISILPLLDDP